MEYRQTPIELDSEEARVLYRAGLAAMILNVVASMALVAGIFWSRPSEAVEKKTSRREPRIIYPKKTELDFEGLGIEGEVRNPGELYFQRRQEEKFGSLVQPRTNFRRMILRDLMQTR